MNKLAVNLLCHEGGSAAAAAQLFSFPFHSLYPAWGQHKLLTQKSLDIHPHTHTQYIHCLKSIQYS